MFLPNLPQKDYFCFEDANKGNCFHKERAGKTTLAPSFGFPPTLNVLEPESNPKYTMKDTAVRAVRSLGAVLRHVLVPLRHSSAFEQKQWKKIAKPTWVACWDGKSRVADPISSGIVPFSATSGRRLVSFFICGVFAICSLTQIPFVQS